MLSLSLFFVLLALIAIPCDAAGKPPPSEAEVRKMKVKALKKFLSARGVECSGCVEKNDFVKKALSVRTMPASAESSGAPIEISDEPLAEQWAAIAKKVCESEVSADQVTQKYCEVLSRAVDNIVMRYSKRYEKQLSVERRQLIKYTMTHPYKTAGELRIRRVAKWMGSHNQKKQDEVEKKLEEPVSHWLRDCAIQNINTMLDTIQGNDEL